MRASDGLFEMTAEIKEEEGVAEFGLKSVFFSGTVRGEGPPMGPFMLWAHRMYAKAWMESAVAYCCEPGSAM